MRDRRDRTLKITEGTIWRQMLRFFFPLLIGTFFQQLYNTVDAIVIGKFVGDAALAAVGGTSGQFMNLLLGLFGGISGGANVIVAQYYGAQDNEAVSRAVHTGIAFSLVAGAFLTVFGYFTTEPMLRLLQTPEEVLPMSKLYMQVNFCAVIAWFVYNIGAGILRAVGDSKRPLYFLMISTVVNIVLDLLFVAVFQWAVFGVAIATAISTVVSAVMVVIVLVRSRGPFRLDFRKIRFHGNELKRIIAIGLPNGIQSSMFAISNLFIQGNVNSFGTTTMAAWTALGKLDGFYWMLSFAFGTSVLTFVGQNFGAKKFDRMKGCVKAGLLLDLIVSLFVLTLFFFFGRPFLSCFTQETATLDLATHFYQVLLLGYLTYIPLEVFANTCRGVGDSLRPTIIMLVTICVFRVIWLAVLVPIYQSMDIVLYSYIISWVLASLVFFFYYKKGSWLKRYLPKDIKYEDVYGRAAKKKMA